jgi:hypothetical protein
MSQPHVLAALVDDDTHLEPFFPAPYRLQDRREPNRLWWDQFLMARMVSINDSEGQIEGERP